MAVNRRVRAVRAARTLIEEWRFRRQPIVPGPTFLCVGLPSCGTTSIAHYLRSHPEVVCGRPKEIGYFNANRHKFPDPDWYRRRFRIRDGRAPSTIRAVGEFTPTYCFPPATDRIAAHQPQVRLIVMVRDPVRRAISQYHRYVRKGLEHRPAEEAIMNSEGNPQRGAYLQRGRYKDVLDTLTRLFPPSQVAVIRLEDLSRDPAREMSRLQQFLGVSIRDLGPYRAANRGTYPPAESSLIEELADYFRPHNLALTEQHGVSLAGWIGH